MKMIAHSARIKIQITLMRIPKTLPRPNETVSLCFARYSGYVFKLIQINVQEVALTSQRFDTPV